MFTFHVDICSSSVFDGVHCIHIKSVGPYFFAYTIQEDKKGFLILIGSSNPVCRTMELWNKQCVSIYLQWFLQITYSHFLTLLLDRGPLMILKLFWGVHLLTCSLVIESKLPSWALSFSSFSNVTVFHPFIKYIFRKRSGRWTGDTWTVSWSYID